MQSLVHCDRQTKLDMKHLPLALMNLVRRSSWQVVRLPPSFMGLADIGLFLRSAITDARIARLGASVGYRTAFETIYAGQNDPWASNDKRYIYQARKYDALVKFLPTGRRYARVLDIGCGLGLLSQRLAQHAEAVVGIDIAQTAVDQASALAADFPNVRFERGDILDLPRALDERFDLVVIADTIYYLPPPLDDGLLKKIALRVAALLAPEGHCLLVNHYFFGADRDSRLSRRIHRAFAWSPDLNVVSEGRRPFYLLSLLSKATVRDSTHLPKSEPSPPPSSG